MWGPKLEKREERTAGKKFFSLKIRNSVTVKIPNLESNHNQYQIVTFELFLSFFSFSVIFFFFFFSLFSSFWGPLWIVGGP